MIYLKPFGYSWHQRHHYGNTTDFPIHFSTDKRQGWVQILCSRVQCSERYHWLVRTRRPRRQLERNSWKRFVYSIFEATLLACIVQNNKFTEFQHLTWFNLKLTSIPWIDTTREHLPRSTNDRRRCTIAFPVQYSLSPLWRRFRPTQHGCSLQKYHFRAMCWHIYCNSVRGAKNVSFTWTRHAGITWVITVHSPCHVCWASQKADLWPVTIDSRHSDSSCSPSEKRRLVSNSGHVSKQHDFVKIIEIVTCL